MRYALILLSGTIFGFGITVSGMINPAKVINFFDFFGTWDPSLIFTMLGALATTAIGYRIVFHYQAAPLYDEGFHVPETKIVDKRLVVGAATFGIGWGISGFCPGGAIPALGLGYMETYVFFGAMIVGIVVGRTLDFRNSTAE